MSKEYYCDVCLHIRGNLVEMITEKERILGQENEVHKCPYCRQKWRINKGQVRHVVASKLESYTALAKHLGIIEGD